MLTYRTGAAGAPWAARNMGEHLLQQTVPPQMAAMADYYGEGVTPPTASEAAAGRYGHRREEGALTGANLDEVLAEETERLRDALNERDDQTLAYSAMGALLAAQLVDPADALAALVRAGYPADDARLEREQSAARESKDYTSAVAAPRRDMPLALANLLGIDPSRSLTPGEIAHLLNGQRADGADIPGKKRQAATDALRTIFGLPRDRLPYRYELQQVLAARKASGAPLPPDQAERAVRRFQAAFGAEQRDLTDAERENILSGRGADGRVLSVRQYQKRLDTSKARIGYVDLTFSAPKSVSVAWAFAPTDAERAIIRQAHRDAIDSVMQEIERLIGRARKGQGGRHGWDPGFIGWVSFDHYAARPTVEVIRTASDGERYTELYTLKAGGARIAGDMQLHTHTAVFNVVLTEVGRVGGLDLAQLEGRVKEWGALYQAFLATNLRRHGVEVGLDPRTEMARLLSVPERVTQHFSKRTLGGAAAARAYAASQGLDWDSLDAERQIGLLKSGVQDPRGAKSDDMSDMETWRRAAAEIGYTHRSVLRPDEIALLLDPIQRHEIAFSAAMPSLTKQFKRRAVIEGSDVRTSAAKGLIASGVGEAAEVGQLTRIFRTRGVIQNDIPTQLIWGSALDLKGRERIAVTTALHEEEEHALIDRARRFGADHSSALTPEQIEAAVCAFPEINFSSQHGQAQRRIIDHLGQGSRLSVAVGVAGSGKSTLLKPLVKAWQDDGRIVHGIALAWRQSDELAEAGILPADTRAVESLLRGLAKDRLTLGSKDVVVIDEVGLLGTGQLNEILIAQERLDFQLVAIGDPKQMQAVEAGPVIALLQRALGEDAIPELGSSVRQSQAEERETVLMLRNGETEAALARKLANGTLRIVPGGYEDAVKAVVALWEERRAANAENARFSITLSAPTNFDAHNVSLAIRQRRRQLGEVAEDRTVVRASDAGGEEARTFDLALAVGDRVRLFRRTNAVFRDGGRRVGNIGRNGSVLEVREIVEEGLVLRATSGNEGLVTWNALKDAQHVLLDYGEVLTTNTAQGSTVTEHIHALPAGSHLVSAFGAYTSGSRHREMNFIVTSEGGERAEVAARRPLGDRREIVIEDIVANMVRNLSRQPVKESSLAFIERAKDLRRGALAAFQSGTAGLEARVSSGLCHSILAQRFTESRANAHMTTQSSRWALTIRQRADDIAAVARSVSSIVSKVVDAINGRKARRARYWANTADRGAGADAGPQYKQQQGHRRRPE